MKQLVEQQHTLTPKGRILGKYILDSPRKAVFMTTKELAETCDVSEATVVRFVSQLGYEAYSVFQQALREGPAVNEDKGLVAPRTVPVDQLGRQVLACAGLTGE